MRITLTRTERSWRRAAGPWWLLSATNGATDALFQDAHCFGPRVINIVLKYVHKYAYFAGITSALHLKILPVARTRAINTLHTAEIWRQPNDRKRAKLVMYRIRKNTIISMGINSFRVSPTAVTRGGVCQLSYYRTAALFGYANCLGFYRHGRSFDLRNVYVYHEHKRNDIYTVIRHLRFVWKY